MAKRAKNAGIFAESTMTTIGMTQDPGRTMAQPVRSAGLATVILFGALTTPYPARMDVGQPTPGLGIIERIDVYSALLWLAVLGIALLRRPDTATEGSLT
ncbi:MAG: hypothetical protein ACXWM3_04120 [Gemmatimonadaceae bacterium]